MVLGRSNSVSASARALFRQLTSSNVTGNGVSTPPPAVNRSSPANTISSRSSPVNNNTLLNNSDGIISVSSLCKQVLVGVKLCTDGQISYGQLHALLVDLRHSLSAMTSITAFRAVMKDLDAVLNGGSGGDGEDVEWLAAARQVVVKVLHELAEVKRQQQVPIHVPKPSVQQVFSSVAEKRISPSKAAVSEVPSPSKAGDTTEKKCVFLKVDEETLKLAVPLPITSAGIQAAAGRPSSGQLTVLHPVHKVFYNVSDISKDIIDGSIIQFTSDSIQKSSRENGDLKMFLKAELEEIRKQISQLAINGTKVRSSPLKMFNSNSASSSPVKMTPSNSPRKQPVAPTPPPPHIKPEPHHQQTSGNHIDNQDELKRKCMDIETAYKSLLSLIDQLKRDILRGHSPPNTYVRQLSDKLEKLSAESMKIQEDLIKNKPAWKQEWEVMLKNIMRAQDNIRDSELVLHRLDDEFDKGFDTIAQCLRVVDVKQSLGDGEKRKFVVPQKDEGHVGMTTVMNELVALDSAKDGISDQSAKRLHAIEDSRKLREAELTHLRSETPFAAELKGFEFKTKASNAGGGVDGIEAARQRKDFEIMQELYRQQADVDCDSIDD